MAHTFPFNFYMVPDCIMINVFVSVLECKYFFLTIVLLTSRRLSTGYSFQGSTDRTAQNVFRWWIGGVRV